MQDFVSVWRRRLGLLSVLAGGTLLVWVIADTWQLRAAQVRAGKQLAAASRVAGPRSATPELPGESHPPREPAPPLALGAVVARIRIADLGLDAVAVEGTDHDTLRHAVGHFPGTALPGEHGNASFAAHRDSFFRGLRNVTVGHRIEVETAWETYVYEVVEARVVEPTQVDVIDPRGGIDLTLVTCYPFDYVGPAPHRFVVHAHLVDQSTP
jgi:sortase A